jgi:putative nucleotidyltransferase with HDIG domain
MTASHPFRWRVLGSSFLVLGCVSVGVLLLDRLATRLEWSSWLSIALGLILSAIVSMVITMRIAWQSRELASSIAQLSLHHAERQAEALRGTTYAETALEWNKALRTLQDSFLDRQTEARKNYSALVELMSMVAKAIDERATYLRGHSERVATYAAEIAREMQLESPDVERIRLAALVHDIGNLGVEDSIFIKNLPLTTEEFEIVKAHTVKGASILRPIEALHDLIPGIELHHESLDGSGYPYGLRGEEIPVMARIIAVADSFDAMTSARPYQSAMDPGYVLEVLERLAGSRYDAAAVQALATLVKRGTIVVKNLRAPVSFQRRRLASELV